MILLVLAVPLVVAFWYWQKTSKALGMSLEKQLWGTLWRTCLYGAVLAIPLTLIAYSLKLNELIRSMDAAPVLFRGLFHLMLLLVGVIYNGLLARYAAGKCRLPLRAAPQMSHLGGSILADASAQQKANADQWQNHLMNKKDGEYIQNVMIGGLWCPLESESRHFKIMGTTGSGKSVAIRTMLSYVQQRAPYTKDRVVIADPDGGYLSRFYKPERGDVILNPFDARSAHWALFRELRNPYDADQFASSLVPDLGGDNSVWAGYARTLVSSTMQALAASGDVTTRDLYDAISVMTNAELGVLLSQTSASRFFDSGAEETLGSIRTNASQALRGLSYLSHNDNFSITEWVRSGSGWLFMPYRADQIAALKPIITTWMRTAIFSTLSLNEGDSRLWFVIDELDALGKIDGLPDALTRLRKFGGRVVLGFQSIGPLETIYGKGYGATITENAGNTLILRCSSSDGGGTSRFASHLVGKRKIKRLMFSSNNSSGSSSAGRHSGSSSGYSEQIAEEDAVMPSEIEQLADMNGFLKFATLPAWSQVRFEYDGLLAKAPAFEPVNQFSR